MHNYQAGLAPDSPRGHGVLSISQAPISLWITWACPCPNSRLPRGQWSHYTAQSAAEIHTKTWAETARDRVQGCCLPAEAELPLRADGAQDKEHPAQGYDLPHAEVFLQLHTSEYNHALIQADWWRRLNWLLYSLLDIFIRLLNRICCSNSTDRCRCVSLKCQSLTGQCNCVLENATAGVTRFNLSWTFGGIFLRHVE